MSKKRSQRKNSNYNYRPGQKQERTPRRSRRTAGPKNSAPRPGICCSWT